MTDFPFTFDQSACQYCGGLCCRWGGYVWVTESDLIAMAKTMNIKLDAFSNEYIKAAYGRLSIQERLRDGEFHCALFNPSNNQCLVYDVRPEQCRTFPYWEQYKSNYQKILKICPGLTIKE
jgi:Fe-S-cluster containining protein